MLEAQGRWEITGYGVRDAKNACLLWFIEKTVSFLINVAMVHFCHGSECRSRRVLVIAGKAEAAPGFLMAFVQRTGPELRKNLPEGWITTG